MASLNIRDFPAELLERVKLKALIERKTLRQAVIDVLGQYADSVKDLAASSNANVVSGQQIKDKLGTEQ